MSAFDLDRALKRAEKRLPAEAGPRRPRSDRGQSRLAPPVLHEIERLLGGQERPPMREILAELDAFCRRRGHRCPSRATVYHLMDIVRPPAYRIEALPGPVRHTLYNLPDQGEVPGHQLAFYCFNYGDTAAFSFAAGLPWLALHQAGRMRGWRRRSRGLLEAVLAARRIDGRARRRSGP
jgi:hypothetical protein